MSATDPDLEPVRAAIETLIRWGDDYGPFVEIAVSRCPGCGSHAVPGGNVIILPVHGPVQCQCGYVYPKRPRS